jgi:CheY-specific phosphatase CheX
VFEEMRQSLVAVMSNTFATMFFLDIEPQEMGKVPGSSIALLPKSPGVAGQSGGFIRSSIRFEGPRSGMISLIFSAALAQLMAKNFLGLEEEEASESQTCDMARELANIISGNLLPALDQKGSYSLFLPKTEPSAYPEVNHPGSRSGCAIDFDAEGHWVQLSIFFDE